MKKLLIDINLENAAFEGDDAGALQVCVRVGRLMGW